MCREAAERRVMNGSCGFTKAVVDTHCKHCGGEAFAVVFGKASIEAALIRAADALRYSAKRSGGNRVVYPERPRRPAGLTRRRDIRRPRETCTDPYSAPLRNRGCPGTS